TGAKRRVSPIRFLRVHSAGCFRVCSRRVFQSREKRDAQRTGTADRKRAELMDFHLPDWPARRLVVEAAIAWGYRHLDEEPIAPYTSPWPKMRRAVLAFLRHQLSDYDSRLCARCEHDQVYRDELVEQIAEAACRKYTWLNSDPRPFPVAESQDDVPLLDSFAKESSNLISIRNHLASAIKDLKRTGCAGEQLGALQQEMTRIDHQIRELYGFLTKPKT